MKSLVPKRGKRAKGQPKSDVPVGYCRPPTEHRWRPGQSGNPKGRKKGSKNEATILRELLYRKIPITQNGRTRKIFVIEAILLRFTEDSLKGNTKSAAFLLSLHRSLNSDEPHQLEGTDDDQKVLAAFAERLLARKGSK